MPINPILPLVYVQEMGPAAKLAHEAVSRPELAQAMARTMSEEMLRQSAQQVQTLEKGAMMSTVSDEGGRQQGHEPHGERQRHADEDDGQPPPSFSDDSPFVGKLINRKV